MADQSATIDPWDLARAPETAARMLKSYSTPVKAAAMAWDHAMDYWTPAKDRRPFVYWSAVYAEIQRLRGIN